METREVAFMGRMTAGMTHELKNVLAIIKESSGLLQDILVLRKGDVGSSHDQIKKVASRIQAQVARGNEQLGSLNWLAHSVSDRSTAVGIHELSSEIVKLMKRFSRLKQVELEVMLAGPDAMIHAEVPGLLVVLAACVEYFLNRESPQGRVVLRTGVSEHEAQIEIGTGASDRPQTSQESKAEAVRLPAELDCLDPILRRLRGRLAWAEPGRAGGLHLILPLTRDEKQ